MSLSNELELELESELSLEGNPESEFAGELEQELDLASELVHEFELEHEHAAEHEAFFNHLAAMADRTGKSQALRRIALQAAKAALRNQPKSWPVIEGESELEFESELESEFEDSREFESELELSPAQQAQAIARMAHAGHAASEASNEQEAAEHFLPLIGLAAKFVLPKLAGLAAKKLGGAALKKVGGGLIRKVGGNLLRRVAPRILRRVTPQLTRSIANVTRTLHRNPSTRPLIHAVPRIARTTVARLGRQIAAGRPISPRLAVRTLAQQTARTLSNPRTLAQTYRRALALDRQYHQRTRRILGRPSGIPTPRSANPIPGSFSNGTPAISPVPGMSSAGGFGGVAGVPTIPAAQSSSPGFMAAPATGYGTCRCAHQPLAAALTPQPVPVPQLPPSCPTCGR